MLRPATPLTILLFAAFVLLLISVLSTPIIKQIPLASFEGVDFGVFGFCQGNKCSKIEIGYDTASLFTNSESSTFALPTNTRTTLSAILIVHPIAALFAFIMFILAATAHFHSPSHSPRYLLGIFILSILTLVLSLLAFLIDVLLFVHHMSWGSYIVLAATILIAGSGIVSCAMRRTLVSRKARKRRIAENAEMNGENFYARQGADPLVPTVSNTLASGGLPDNMPGFASFAAAGKEKDRTSDERVPLTTTTPTENSSTNGQALNDRNGGPTAGSDFPQRDQYGNVIPRPPPGQYGMRSRDPSADAASQRQYSDQSMNSRGRGGMPQAAGYRGGYRGGYGGERGRGGNGPPRGGYGPPRGGGYAPGRGGYGASYKGDPTMSRGGRGGAPPGYGPLPGRGDYSNRGMPPAAGYGARRSSSQPRPYDPYAGAPSAGGYTPYNPDDSRSSFPRAESPPPLSGVDDGFVGQAVEMDAATGSPQHAPTGFGRFGNIRESDGDVAGMVGLQQQRLQRRETATSSQYSTDEAYVPPRQAWGNQPSSPLNPSAATAELPASSVARHKRSSSGDNYYEDIDPRFAEPPSHPSAMPPALNTSAASRLMNPNQLAGSYEDIQSGARSPAESDRSNFTSVSQRGVNPRWNGGGYAAPVPNRRPVNTAPNQQRDILLTSNPDFELPGARGGRRAPAQPSNGLGPSSGMVPNSAYPV